MNAQDIIYFVENHNKEEGDIYLNSLFDGKNISDYSRYISPKDGDVFVAKDEVNLRSPMARHFPYTIDTDTMQRISRIDIESEKEKRLLNEISQLDSKKFEKELDKYGRDISSVEILLKICEYNNKHKESNIVDRLLEAAHKNGIEWCDIAKNRKHPYFHISTLCKYHSNHGVNGQDLKSDLKGIKELYEFGFYETYEAYQAYLPIREQEREFLFNKIATGEFKYPVEQLLDVAKHPDICINGSFGTVGSASVSWADKSEIIETDAYKRAMRRIEYEIYKEENKELFATNDFIKLTGEQKNLVLEFTDSKEVAKAIIDTYKGNIEYNDLIARHFTREKFEQAVEDYKITQYRCENEKLSAENTQLKEEHKNVEKAKTELADEQTKFQRYVDDKSAELKAKSEQLGFQKDIQVVCLDSQKEVDSFAPERKKELFTKMKEEMLKNPNLREGHLVGMCKIYVSETNTPEQKAEYFEGLHEVRKSGKTNSEKREMAHTFERVLERNPDLAKDESLQGLAKIDYSAVGYTPTRRGFSRNS